MKKRCEMTFVDGIWHVSLYPGGGVPPEVLTFNDEREALLAVSTWCAAERKGGYPVELALPKTDGASQH